MIGRYSREEISKIWDINTKFDYYLQVELAVCDAYAELGTISKEISSEIRQSLLLKELMKLSVKLDMMLSRF